MNRKLTSKIISLILLSMAIFILSACSALGKVFIKPTPTITAEAPCGSATQESSSGCVLATDTPSPSSATELTPIFSIPLQPETQAFTEADLQNATYSIKDFAEANGGSDTVTLVNGNYAYIDPANPPDPSNYTVQYQKSAIGDLNFDGKADAAVILIADTSGSGTFIYLAAMVSGESGLSNIDTILLGDRVIVETIAVQDWNINLQMIVHGPQDGLCCPSVKTNQTYLLDDGLLVNQAEKIAAPLADQVIQALKAKDMTRLSRLVDPSAGVRFSPYTNVMDNDQLFYPAQLLNAFSDSTVYIWGYYDGSGEPIQLTFAEYYDRFVYSQDFASSSNIGFNVSLSSGNMIDNSHDFYPGAIIVEYYLPGTGQNNGLDWQSLKLVFKQSPMNGSVTGGKWFLVGIIHSQWTI